MRFLQLNGKASRTIPLRAENMALSGERFGPIILQCFCLLCFLYIWCTVSELASDVSTALTLLHGGRSRLRVALQLATQDRPPLSDGLVDDILHLCDLLERAYGTPDGAIWVRETLRDVAVPHRPDRTESSASDFFTTTGQRRREEPSSGRGKVEKVVLFFLAKQGELASRLLNARREINNCKTGETYICFGATAKEMEEEWLSDSPISRYGDSPARSLGFVYLSIGGEIAE